MKSPCHGIRPEYYGRHRIFFHAGHYWNVGTYPLSFMEVLEERAPPSLPSCAIGLIQELISPQTLLQMGVTRKRLSAATSNLTNN
jgi:hypothetical protein